MIRAIQAMVMIMIAMVVFISGPTDRAWAQQNASKDKNITYSGEHGRNTHVKTEETGTEIVKGTIFSVRGNTVVMDGESFSITGAKIHDQLGRSLRARDLYPGLKVHLVFRNGAVFSVSVKNFLRGKVVTDPQEVERMRQRAIERKGR